MTSSVPSDFPEGKLPLLNCQVWMEKVAGVDQIRYEHFEKTMSSKFTIQNESALPDKVKRATLVQGGITRLLNTSRELGEEAKIRVMNKYMMKLKTSGYDHKMREEVLRAIENGWKKIVTRDEKGERPIYRSREYKREERKEEKENKNKDWYKGKGGKQYESVIFIPATPNSSLKNEVEKIAIKTGIKVKVVEKAGQKMIDYLKSFDKSTRAAKCMEEDCLVCKAEKGGPCRKYNIVYKLSCK